jgi:hypothetical protein
MSGFSLAVVNAVLSTQKKRETMSSVVLENSPFNFCTIRSVKGRHAVKSFSRKPSMIHIVFRVNRHHLLLQ